MILLVCAEAEAPRGAGPAAALELLAPLELARDLRACLERCARGDVDLVVVDEALGREAEEIVARLRRTAAALLVLQREASDAGALAWFRRGASDCVVVDPAWAELRRVVREQLERVQALRAGVAAPREAGPAADGILSHLGSALVVLDGADGIVFANPAAEEILDCPQERLRGRRFRDFLISEEGEPIPAGSGGRGVEARLCRADGREVPIALSVGPLGEGRAQGAVAVFHDLSAAQEWRSHVLQTEKMASIGQLAAGVAHEINNPMGFIHANLFQMSEYVGDLRQVWSRVEGLLKAVGAGDRGASERSATELAELAGELDVGFLLQDLAKAIRESQEGSERIRHIVQDLRDFSHQDTGERVLADLNQCLDSTANIVWPMMKHMVVLERDYAELPPVPCYPMQLKQVFMNLLVNAYQAIEEARRGSGELGTVRLVTALHQGGVQVEVSDTGVGIEAERLDRIFEPFHTTKNVGAGTGLGLSTSFHIVRRHGGTLAVESQPGRGSVFRIRLPLLAAELGAAS